MIVLELLMSTSGGHLHPAWLLLLLKRLDQKKGSASNCNLIKSEKKSTYTVSHHWIYQPGARGNKKEPRICGHEKIPIHPVYLKLKGPGESFERTIAVPIDNLQVDIFL